MADLRKVDYTRKTKELVDIDEQIAAQRRSSVREAYRELRDNSRVDEQSGGRGAESGDAPEGKQMSLDMGSPEYREMIYDHLGYDELEQEKMVVEIDQRGEREGQVGEVESDKWHAGYNDELVADRAAHLQAHNERVRPQPRRVKGFEHLLKEAVADKALHGLGGMVAATTSRSDDARLREVERELDDVGANHTDFEHDAEGVERLAEHIAETEM